MGLSPESASRALHRPYIASASLLNVTIDVKKQRLTLTFFRLIVTNSESLLKKAKNRDYESNVNQGMSLWTTGENVLDENEV